MALDDDVRDLARLPIFHEIEPEALRLLAFSGEMKILRAGDALFRRGDQSDAGYLVQSGSFRTDSAESDGPEIIIHPHSLIGEIALLTKTLRPATIVAREPSTVLKISRAAFHRVLKEHPKSAIRVRAALESRLSSFTGEIASKHGHTDSFNL